MTPALLADTKIPLLLSAVSSFHELLTFLLSYLSVTSFASFDVVSEQKGHVQITDLSQV